MLVSLTLLFSTTTTFAQANSVFCNDTSQEGCAFKYQDDFANPTNITERTAPASNKTILDALFALFSKIFFNAPSNKEETFISTENTANTTTPSNLKPNTGNAEEDYTDWVTINNLNADMPPNLDNKPVDTWNVQFGETAKECGLVPCDQGVHPITGQK